MPRDSKPEMIAPATEAPSEEIAVEETLSGTSHVSAISERWARAHTSLPELPFVLAALFVYLVFQVHAVANHGYWGQDILEHRTNISLASYDPWTYITTYRELRTNPPLYHVVAGFVKHIIGLPYDMIAIGLMNVLFGLAGMIAFYGLSCRLILSPVLRFSALLFVLFVPFAVIHAEVIASDALATPLFLIFVWVLVSLPFSKSPQAFSRYVAAASLLVMAGILTKFTFGSALAGSILWLAMLWRTRLLTGRRLAIVFALVTALPAVLAYAQMRQFSSQEKYALGIEKPSSLSELWNAEMSPRNLLFVKAADVEVLSAPSYDWNVNGDFPLLEKRRHSFPALLHLGMFTDILNTYQGDPYFSYYGSRTLRNHHRMQLAVRFGILFSLLTVAGVLVVLTRSAIDVFLRRAALDAPVMTVLLFSIAWFLNIVAFLPLIPGAYHAGYWLPRLIAPALLGFFLTAFVFLDRIKIRSRELKIAIVVLVAVQSTLNASFLWPTRSWGPFYEPNEDLVAIKAPAVSRIYNWQHGGIHLGRPGYWLGSAMGVVIDRHAGPPEIEKWTLSFVAAPGPANPAAHRRLRISCQYCESKSVDFSALTRITLEVPAAAGRNDVRIETLEPEQVVDKAGDPSMQLVHITDIDVTRNGRRALSDYSPRAPRGSIVSVSPRNATTPNQTFTVAVTDWAGYEDVEYVYFLVNDSPVIPRNTCHGYYHRPTGAVLLYRDTTTYDRVGGVAGKGPILTNGLCSVDAAATSAQGSGTDLTVNFALSLDASYNDKNVYFWVKDHDQHDTGWIDTGTHWKLSEGTVVRSKPR